MSESKDIGRGALDRLNDIREHQNVAHEIAGNWQGWLGSLLLHSSLLLLLVALTWSVVAPPKDGPEVLIETPAMEPMKPDEKPDVPDCPINTPVPAPPSIPALGEVPNPAMVKGPEDLGVPDWIGIGFPYDGRPGDGDPGLTEGGRRVIGRLKHGGYDRLDIVFVFDSTGSMGGIIMEVKTRISQFVTGLKFFVPNIRLGVVTYRDKKKYDLDEYEYTVKYLPLTTPRGEGMEKIQRFLRETQAYGGGDIPEAVEDGVETAFRMDWRDDAKKVIIVFGDAPPRPEDSGVSKLVDGIRAWHGKTGGVVATIDTTGKSKLMDEFRQMAEAGGGQSCFLNDERAIIRQLMLSCFPAEFKDDLGTVLDRFFRQNERDVIEKK